MKRLDNIEEYNNIINNSLVFVIFYNTFHSTMFVKDSYVKRLVENHPEVDFYGVNIDQLSDILEDSEISKIPFISRFENGYEIKQISALATLNELEEFIK
ncbi:MAG: thioredoxin family protein [Bacilli bacterium]|nr:thioredoxin family protein [Bacilli bacterium]